MYIFCVESEVLGSLPVINMKSITPEIFGSKKHRTLFLYWETEM